MGSVSVVIADIFADEIVEVFLAKKQEVVQTFLFDALDNSLASGVQLRTLDRQHLDLHTVGFQDLIKLSGGLRVTVADQRGGRTSLPSVCIRKLRACCSIHSALG